MSVQLQRSLFNKLQLRIYLCFLFVLGKVGVAEFSVSQLPVHCFKTMKWRVCVRGVGIQGEIFSGSLQSDFFQLCFSQATVLFLHCTTINSLLGLCISLYLVKIIKSNCLHSKSSEKHWSSSSLNFACRFIWFFFNEVCFLPCTLLLRQSYCTVFFPVLSV